MSVMKELHSEITRLARKEIKKELEPIKRVNAAQRGYIADLRRDVGELQKEVADSLTELENYHRKQAYPYSPNDPYGGGAGPTRTLGNMG